MGQRPNIDLERIDREIRASGLSKPHSISHWARIFGVSWPRMKSWLEKGIIKAEKTGRAWRIYLRELPRADSYDPESASEPLKVLKSS